MTRWQNDVVQLDTVVCQQIAGKATVIVFFLCTILYCIDALVKLHLFQRTFLEHMMYQRDPLFRLMPLFAAVL